MFKKIVVPLLLLVALAAPSNAALACGGLFCQNVPVDQNAERIIFTQNRNGTVSAIIQIQYTGSAPDFSWILPISSPITADDIEVPETAVNAFFELETQTNPVYLPPPMPECAQVVFENMEFAASAEDDGDVVIYASGEVGPYEFDVIGSEDPLALIRWLRENGYLVTEAMEPLINVYVEEGFTFLAMRLLPDEGVNSIAPVKVTFRSEAPMIPLRLTAVAANPDMAVLVWIYADRQAVPVNYAHMKIRDEEIIFFTFGGSNYRQLLGERADEFGGQAFVTEYAAPTRELAVNDPLLRELAREFPYVTRLNTVISPEEMTVDPVFAYDPQAKDVSNIHDLSWRTDAWDCQQEELVDDDFVIPFIGPLFSPGKNNNPNQTGGSSSSSSTGQVLLMGICLGVFFVALLGGAIGFGVWMGRRGPAKEPEGKVDK